MSDSCDPADFLKEKSTKVDVSSLVDLEYLIHTTEKESKTVGGGASADIFGFQIGGDYAESFAKSLEQLIDYKLTSQERKTLFISELDEKGVEAYQKCLKGQNKNREPISITMAEEDSLFQDEFFLVVHWHPSGTPSALEVPISLEATEGVEIVDNPQQ